MARERLGDELEITERKYTIDEVIEADAEGRLIESFAAGTAVSLYLVADADVKNARLTHYRLVLCLPRLCYPPPRQGYQHPHGPREHPQRHHLQDQDLDWRHHVRQCRPPMGRCHP